MNQNLKIIFIAAFMGIISAPFLQKQLHPLPEFTLTENRTKIAPPETVRLLLKPGGVFARLYEDHYNDTYGLRDLLIRLKHQLDYWLFHTSDTILIGKDNWLFYKDVVEKEQIDIEKAGSAAFDRMFANILKLNQYLAARGITLVMLPCPMKNGIYPEMLPPNTVRRPSPMGFARYMQFLRSHPEIVTLDPIPRLQELKPQFNVYYKTDFHWTDLAGAYIARDLVNLLGQKAGSGSLWNQQIQMKSAKRSDGGENNSLALLWPIQEKFLSLDTSGIIVPIGDYINTRNPNEWSYRSKLTDTSCLLPFTVMFGDSYADSFRQAGFSKYFSGFQKFYNLKFKDKFHEIPPNTKFLVFQHIESNLVHMLKDDFWPVELR